MGMYWCVHDSAGSCRGYISKLAFYTIILKLGKFYYLLKGTQADSINFQPERPI